MKEQFVKKKRKSAEFEFLYLDIAIVSPNLVTSTKINDKWKFTQVTQEVDITINKTLKLYRPN